MKQVQSIGVWGDSVMKGVIYDEEKARYTLLSESGADKASRKLGLRLFNRSRMGCTVTKGLSLLKKDLQKAERPCDAALIEFGGNDCDYAWEEVAAHPEAEHQPKTPLPLFVSQLRDMIALVRQKGMEPVMMTLPPIHAQRYFDFFTRGGLSKDNVLAWLGDVQHIYRWHERYNAAVVRVAQACGCPLADVRDAFLAERDYGDLLCADGIHPNEKGHLLMENVLEGFGFHYRREGILAV